MTCNFPLVCGRNKGVCCHHCSLNCDFKCKVDEEECPNKGGIKKVQDIFGLSYDTAKIAYKIIKNKL